MAAAAAEARNVPHMRATHAGWWQVSFSQQASFIEERD